MKTPIAGELKQTLCDLNGKIEEEKDGKHHFYIILTEERYNLTSRGHVLAIPFKSKWDLEVLNYGIDLTNNEILGNFKLDKDPSYILYDRICRLKIPKDLKLNEHKEHIPKECTKVSKDVLKKIRERISLFIKFGRKS